MAKFHENRNVIPWSGKVNHLQPQEILSAIHRKLADYKLVSPYYQHVDGTSFQHQLYAA